MPSGGAAIRAEQLATVGRIAHTKFISADIGRLLDDLRDFGEQHDYDSFEASLIRVATRDWEKASKVPPDLRAEMSRSASLANPVWVAARRENDFALVPACAPEEPRSAQALHRLLRGRRRAVRHRARRLRARHEDDRGAAHLRLPQGAPGAARQGGRRAGAGGEAREDVRHRRPEDLRARGRARVRFHRRRVAPRPNGAPIRVGNRRDRHPHHNALLHRRPRRPLRDDARVRARLVRAPGRSVARAVAARARGVARVARVAEPHVGEPRRPVAAVLAALLPARYRSCSPPHSPGTMPRAGTAR